MALPTEINAITYYILELKSKGFDILQELEVLNSRRLQLINELNKNKNELQLLYKKIEEESAENSKNESIKEEKSIEEIHLQDSNIIEEKKLLIKKNNENEINRTIEGKRVIRSIFDIGKN